MNALHRPFLTCLLVLSLLSLGWLDGRGMALARTGVIVVEICAEGAKQTVTLAANGDIIEDTAHGGRSPNLCTHCPDCVLPLALALADVPQGVRPGGDASRVTAGFAKTGLLAQAQTLPQARAPPERA